MAAQRIQGSEKVVQVDSTGYFETTGLLPKEASPLYLVYAKSETSGFWTPDTIYNVPVDSAPVYLIYKRIKQVLKVTVFYQADSTPVAQANVLLENKDKGQSIVQYTNQSGIAVFSDWEYLVANDLFKITAEKFSLTIPAYIDNLTLDVAQETTYVTLYLARSSIVSLVILIDGKLEDNVRVTNNQTHVCSYLAIDALGRTMHLNPDSSSWSHKPMHYVSGDPDSNFYGTLTPYLDELGHFKANFKPDSTTIGRDIISLQTKVAGKIIEAQPKVIRLYAPLASNTIPDGSSITLKQYRGIKLVVETSDLPANQLIGFTVQRGEVAEVKSSTAEYRAKGYTYRLSFITGSGEDLNESNGIQILEDKLDIYLPIPEDVTATDEVKVGMWSIKSVTWIQLDVTQRTPDYIASQFKNTESGEFALIVASAGLAIEQIELTPNPFSPYVLNPNGTKGLNVFFKINSRETREPLVTARIYSVEGRLVKILCRHKPFNKGKEVQLIWDGKSEADRMCRNGRYIFCLLYTSPSPRDLSTSRMPSSA